MGIDFHLIANFGALALITLAGPAVIFILSSTAAEPSELLRRVIQGPGRLPPIRSGFLNGLHARLRNSTFGP